MATKETNPMPARRTLFEGRGPTATLTALATLAVLGCLALTASAQAATPAWKVLGVTGPTHLPPAQSEIDRLAVDAEGGTFTLTVNRLAATASGTINAGTTFIFPFNTNSGTAAAGQTIVGDHIAPGTTIVSIGQSFGTPFATLSKPTTNTSQVTNATFYTAGASDTTQPLAFDAGAAELEAELDDLSTVGGEGGSVAVSGGPGDKGATSPYRIEYGGSFATTDLPAIGLPVLEVDDSALTGDGTQSATVSTSADGGPGTGEVTIHIINVGGAATSGTYTLEIGPLPAGIETADSIPEVGGFNPWDCEPEGAGHSSLSCTRSFPVPAGRSPRQLNTTFPVTIGASAAPSATVPVSIEGGGAGPAGGDEFEIPVTISPDPAPAGVQELWAGAFDENGLPFTQAGGHPYLAGAYFRVNTVHSLSGEIVPAGELRDIDVEVPPGFVGNPRARARCPGHDPVCNDPDAVVGNVQPHVFQFDAPAARQVLYGVEPPLGHPAQFSFLYVVPDLHLFGDLRSDGDYGATVSSPNTTTVFKLYGAVSMLDGFPAGGGGVPFLTNPTGCSDEAQGTPVTTIMTNSWQQPSIFDRVSHEVPKVTGCDQLAFEPSFTFQPDNTAPASPTGAVADLSVPQDGLVDGAKLASPHLKKSVVTLPEGLVLNPSAANGLAACSTGQIGLKGTDFPDPNPVRFDKSSPRCPEASKVGTAEIETPLLEDKLNGSVYLAAQGDNPFGSLIGLYIVVDDSKTGITVKLAGRVDPDPQSGRVTATFDHNPQVPFSDLKLRFGGGPRANLSTPDVCGSYSTAGVWTPWSAPDSGPAAQTSDAFAISSGPGGGACAPSKAARPFGLGMNAGAADRTGRAFAPLTLRLTRPDGSQELDRIDVATPKGLLASLRGVPYCPEPAVAQAIARSGRGAGAVERALPSCPAASQVGTTSVGAGVGPQPFYAGGNVYLAGPYKGAPLSLVVVVPAVAGPFDLGVQVVRTALHVDRRTAQVTAVSDAIPKIIEGVPLQIQDVRIHLDRPGFTLNPSDCSAKQVRATVRSAWGARADLANHFQASGCAALPYEPRMAMRLTGRRQVRTGRHPGVRAVVRQDGVGEGGIAKAEVTLPKSLALDPDNARALCEFEDGTKPDLENHCPKGSIVGRARAKTPLLDDDLAGNVYFVKNVRIDRDTGNEIRTLPMVIVALRGQVAVNLVGESSTTRSGRLVNTFADVPDAPISRFDLAIRGGRNGILTVTRTRRSEINLCARPKSHVAAVDTDGQNGKRHDFDVRMRTPCRKGRRSAAKICRRRTDGKREFRRCVSNVRKVRAKRAAAKRRAASRRARG
jgi:hypothetical protein